jgi:hypothetical protein
MEIKNVFNYKKNVCKIKVISKTDVMKNHFLNYD